MRHPESPLPTDHLKRRFMLAIIVLAGVATIASWAVLDKTGRMGPSGAAPWLITMVYIAALFVVAWYRLLRPRIIELGCLLFAVAICGMWMAMCLYVPAFAAPTYIEPLYLWILVIYVFAFTLAGHRSSLAVALVALAIFVAISLPYMLRDPDGRYVNFTIQLHVVSLVLIAALYFFSSYQHRLRLAEVEVDTLAQLSNTDELTQLPNRRQMAARIDAALAMRPATPGFAVLLLDIDLFKTINDRFGHAGGDAALIALATRAREMLRGSDVMGRWGGDEFVILLPDIGPEDALRKADALCHHIAAEPLLHDQVFTISCGVAMAVSGDTCDSVLQRADAALYRAKQEGRDRAVAAPADDAGAHAA